MQALKAVNSVLEVIESMHASCSGGSVVKLLPMSQEVQMFKSQTWLVKALNPQLNCILRQPCVILGNSKI